MKTRSANSALVLVLVLSLVPVSWSHGQIGVVIDPPPVSRTMDDFNDGVDTSTNFSNATSAGEANGVTSVTVAAGAPDPQVQFPTPGPPFDIAKYPHFRLSSRSDFGGGSQVFPLPPSGVTVVGYQTGTTFAEARITFNTDPPGANGTGFRIDPVPSGGATDDTFDYDYIVLDKFETIGLAEYDRDNGFEGFEIVGNGHITNAQVSAATSTLSATTSGVDPVMQRAGLAVDASRFTVLEIRAAFDPLSISRFEVFWGTNVNPGPVAGQSLVVTGPLIRDGELHTYRFQMSDDARWSNTLQVLRIDPLADADAAAGRSIEIDYVRLIAGAPVSDLDQDGLPDVVETGTGVLVDGCDTGSDATLADTDGDGFDDGAEFRSGTDPNDALSNPAPTLEGYTDAPVAYGVGAPIVPNDPVIDFGAPSNFTVSPPLPGGLVLDPITGRITGTPSVVTAAADYTITAMFDGSPDSDFDLNIEVTNPYIVDYSRSPVTYRRGENAGFNDPVLSGAAPEFFMVSPPLPEGLSLEPNGGTITGTPTGFQGPADYVITAGYAGYPDATFTLTIAVEAVPVLVVDPAQALTSFVPLGEFETDGDTEFWGSSNATISAAGGFLVVNTTAGDPQVFKGGLALDTSGGANTVLEFRLRQSDAEFIEFFWGDGNGGLSGARRFGIEGAAVPGDGDFHVYQVDMTGVFSGNLDIIRLDPGPGAGRTVEFDYIRLGSFTEVESPRLTEVSYDLDLEEATVTWTSVPGQVFRVEVSGDLRSWIALETAYPAAGVGERTSYLDVSAGLVPESYYRVVRVGN